MYSDPHLLSLALARKKGNKTQEETGESVLVCVSRDGVRAAFNVGSVRTRIFPDSPTEKLL